MKEAYEFQDQLERAQQVAFHELCENLKDHMIIMQKLCSSPGQQAMEKRAFLKQIQYLCELAKVKGYNLFMHENYEFYGFEDLEQTCFIEP